MPSYKVLEPGFYGGKQYHPEGKRRILSTSKPFKQTPSWLKQIDEAEEDRIVREKAEVAQTNAANEKKINQKKETDGIDFLKPLNGKADVETLT